MKKRKAEEIVAGLIGPHQIEEAVPRLHKHLQKLGRRRQFTELLAFAVDLESDLSARTVDLRNANDFLQQFRADANSEPERKAARPRRKKKKAR